MEPSLIQVSHSANHSIDINNISDGNNGREKLTSSIALISNRSLSIIVMNSCKQTKARAEILNAQETQTQQ